MDIDQVITNLESDLNELPKFSDLDENILLEHIFENSVFISKDDYCRSNINPQIALTVAASLPADNIARSIYDLDKLRAKSLYNELQLIFEKPND
jgi:hypothetical protein